MATQVRQSEGQSERFRTLSEYKSPTPDSETLSIPGQSDTVRMAFGNLSDVVGGSLEPPHRTGLRNQTGWSRTIHQRHHTYGRRAPRGARARHLRPSAFQPPRATEERGCARRFGAHLRCACDGREGLVVIWSLNSS
jgi:hypothetical protein